MVEALQAAGELSLICACLVAIGLLLLAEALVQGLLGPLTHIPGAGGIIGRAEDALTAQLRAAINRLSKWLARLYSGLMESLYLLVGGILLLFVALYELSKWLYHQAVGAHGTASVAELQKRLDNEEKKAKAAAAAAASSAAAARALAAQLQKELHGQTAPLVAHLANDVIPALRKRETDLEHALATVTDTALPGVRTRVKSLEQELAHVNERLRTAEAEITVLEHPATRPAPAPIPAPVPAPIPAPVPAPIPGPQGIPGERGEPGPAGAPGEAAEGGGGTIDLPGLGTISLGAAVALTYGAVQTIALEAGLSTAECRGKVRGICGTDPSSWGELLAGIAFLEGALSLREIAPVARVAVHELSGLIKQAA